MYSVVENRGTNTNARIFVYSVGDVNSATEDMLRTLATNGGLYDYIQGKICFEIVHKSIIDFK